MVTRTKKSGHVTKTRTPRHTSQSRLVPPTRTSRETSQSSASSSGTSEFLKIREKWKASLGAEFPGLIMSNNVTIEIYRDGGLFDIFKRMNDKQLNIILSLFDSIHDFYKGTRSSERINGSFSTKTTMYVKRIFHDSMYDPPGLAFLYSLYRDTGNEFIKKSIALLDILFHLQPKFYQDVKTFIRKSTKTQIAHVPFSMLPNQFIQMLDGATVRSSSSRLRKICPVDELENLIWLLCIHRMESKVDNNGSTRLIGSIHKSVGSLISDVMSLSDKHYFHVDAGWSINEDVYHLENQSNLFNKATHTTIAQYMDPSNGGSTTLFAMIYRSRPGEKRYTINRRPDVMYDSHFQGEYDGVDYKFKYYVDIHQKTNKKQHLQQKTNDSLVTIDNKEIKKTFKYPISGNNVDVEQPSYIIRALVTPHSRNKEKGYKDKTIILYWGNKNGSIDVKCNDDNNRTISHDFSKNVNGSITNLYCRGGDMIGVSEIALEININIGKLTSNNITDQVIQENVKFLLDLKRAGDSFQFKFANDLTRFKYDYNAFVLTGDRMASTIAMVNNYQHISSISSQIYIYRKLKDKDIELHGVYKSINENSRLNTIKRLESFEKKIRELLISVVAHNPYERNLQKNLNIIKNNINHIISRNNPRLNRYDELSGEDLNAASALLELGSRNAMQT